MRLIDKYSHPKFHNAAAMEWLCFRLDMLSAITFAFSLVFLISIPDGTIDPSKCFFLLFIDYPFAPPGIVLRK